MREGNGALPKGWAEGTLADVTVKKVEQVKRQGPLTYIDIGAINNVAKRIDQPEYLGKGEKIPSRARQLLAANDVLVSMTRPNLNAVAKVPPDLDGVIGSTGFDVLRTIEVAPEWLFTTVRSRHFVESMSEIVQGALYPAVRPSDIRKYKFLIPPLPEQRRIVAKIEALQERSSRARQALAEVGPLLDQFRQSVLAVAFSGRLTADWRAAHPDVEPASELLKRIRIERRERWQQAELAKYEAKGKEPPKGWREKYEEPASVDAEGLPDLPEGWCWVRAEEVCEYITKGTTPPKGKMREGAGEIRFLKVGNLTFTGSLDFTKENSYIDSNTHNHGVYARSRIYPGDVLMNLVGPPLGKVSLVTPEVPQSNVNQAIAIFRPIRGLHSEYLTAALIAPSILDRIIQRAKATAGQRNLTLDMSRQLPLPLAPSDEQRLIAAQIQAAMARIDELELSRKKSESLLSLLDQSILAKAFRGELVPQDPSDEPASVLLERIRAQREAAAQNGKPARKNREAPTAKAWPTPSATASEPATNDKPATKPNKVATVLDADVAMAAYRASLWGQDDLTETELLRAAAERLGYERLGKNVRTELTPLLKKARRRQIVARVGENYYCPTSIFRNYDREFLLTQLAPVMRKGKEYTREAVAQNLATYLGYANVTPAMREHLKSVFNAAIRRGILVRNGKWVWRG